MMVVTRFLTICAAGLLLAGLAMAGPDPEEASAVPDIEGVAPVPDRDRALERVEDYLNDIETLEASFIQVGPDGGVAEGEVSLQRPGRLRFEYGRDVPILVVSDGSMLTFIDYDVSQVTRWPISDTPLGILVARDIDLRSSVIATTSRDRDGLLRVQVIDPRHEDQGFITLIFEDDPLTLKAWEVVDAQGLVTRVAIVNPVYNTSLSAKLFTYEDPRTMPFSGRRKRR